MINALKNTVSGTVSVGAAPQRLSVAPNGLRVYVPNSEGHSLSVIDTASNTVAAQITLDQNPAAAFAVAIHKTVWLATREAGNVVPLSVP